MCVLCGFGDGANVRKSAYSNSLPSVYNDMYLVGLEKVQMLQKVRAPLDYLLALYLL